MGLGLLMIKVQSCMALIKAGPQCKASDQLLPALVSQKDRVQYVD